MAFPGSSVGRELVQRTDANLTACLASFARLKPRPSVVFVDPQRGQRQQQQLREDAILFGFPETPPQQQQQQQQQQHKERDPALAARAPAAAQGGDDSRDDEEAADEEEEDDDGDGDEFGFFEEGQPGDGEESDSDELPEADASPSASAGVPTSQATARQRRRSCPGHRRAGPNVDAVIRRLKWADLHDTLRDEVLLPILREFANCLINIADEDASPELINAAMIWLRLCKDPARTLAEGTAATEVRLLLILDTEAMLARLKIGEISPKMAKELAALRAMMGPARAASLAPLPSCPCPCTHTPTDATFCAGPWQLRTLLVTHGFAVHDVVNDSYEVASPIAGYSAVDVLYALLVDAVKEGKVEEAWLRADCA